MSELARGRSIFTKDLVGINSRMAELGKHSCIGLNNIRMVGIYGMGGIGKTTTTRAAYGMLSCHFEGRSFIANVKEASEEVLYIIYSNNCFLKH